MKIKNIHGSQGTHYRDIGLSNWMNYKGKTRKPICSAFGCNKTATDGAHVIKVNSSDHNWYICPLCREHNLSTDEILLSAEGVNNLVPLKNL